MTSPGGGGPIETAYVEIKPKVDPQFAADLRKQILPIIKKISKEAEAAFKQIGASSKSASTGVSGLSRSLSGASKSASNFAANATKAANAASSLQRASGSASAALRSTGGAAQAAGRGAQEAGNRFNFLARALVVGGVYAAGQALSNLGKFGIGAAASLEQTQIAFQGLFGNTADADAFIKRLQAFAAKTPFEFPELAKASQRLLALGQTGDQAVKTLTTVGNAAAAVGADQTAINRVIVALAQIQAKGKLSAEEINQVGEALPNLNRGAVIENLAETFGVTTEKIREMQQKGLIPAKEGTEALLKTLQEVPGALGAMDRQSLTLIGRFSTFKDTIKANFSNVLVDSLPFLGDALLRLTDTISAQLATFGPALAQSLIAITPLIEGFVNFIGPLLTGLLTTISPILAQFSVALGPIGEAFGTILAALGPALIPLAAVLAQVGVALAPVLAALGVQLAEALIAVTPLIILFSNALIAMLGFLAAHPTLLGDLAIAVVAVLTALKGYAIIGTVTTAIKAFAGGTVAAAFASGGFTAALAALRVAILANPIGLIIGAVALLVGGFILLYRHSETFRKGIGVLRDFAVTAFKFMVDKILGYYQFLIEAGAKVFGWVPGLGPKLEQAAVAVAQFRDKVNATLDGITKEVNINVVTTYTIAELKSNEAAAARNKRIQDRLSGIPRGAITPEDRADIAKRVDAEIAAEAAARKKVSAPKPTVEDTGKPQFLSGGAKGGGLAKAESAAKKAAAAVKKALVKLADAALAAAKKVADGLKTKLKTAQDALKGLLDKFNDIRKAVAEAFTVDLFTSRSANQFIKRAAKNIRTNTTVLANQEVLQSTLGKKTGGSEFLRQLFESGNTRLIKNLAGQSSAVLADVLAKFNQDNALANKIGTAVANAFIVGGRPLVVGIKNVQEEIIKLQKALLIALAKVEAATKARARLKAASGGIFSSATDLQVGEAGTEVVVPLTRPGAALELLLKSGALGLPTVAAHVGGLQSMANSQSMARLGGGSSSRSAGGLSLVPSIKVVKERVVNQTFNIHEAGDARLTAASVAARTAAHMDR